MTQPHLADRVGMPAQPQAHPTHPQQYQTHPQQYQQHLGYQPHPQAPQRARVHVRPDSQGTPDVQPAPDPASSDSEPAPRRSRSSESDTAPPAGGRRARRRAKKRTPVIGDYLGYATTFVGAGLISGAVVHHPLDPDRYTVIALVGAGVFLCATLLNEFVLKRQRPSASTVVAIVLASLALSFGIGMLSGGLQHFEDFPERAAMLIPFGLALSFVAYVLRYDAARWRSIIGPTGLLVLVTAAVAFVGLRGIAADMAAESGGGGHGHSHGEEGTSDSETAVTEDSHTADSHTEDAGTKTPDASPSAESTGSTGSGAGEGEAGHAEDGHAH
ncbi:DMT family transporter [Streptomyces capitiformicae]|uniref:Uncharacterized protein n=1 Tax=Streptomyces capitiformicae TaxID=2014920 RepID=A0A919DP40_9ACTN|nr:DMT family transporter [Streptomyces capitiformicae]GHE65099.1 hypothetical protein GCM10017771_88710 [Streptomyces capitiformicae]